VTAMLPGPLLMRSNPVYELSTHLKYVSVKVGKPACVTCQKHCVQEAQAHNAEATDRSVCPAGT
jgi:hypothetical protein